MDDNPGIHISYPVGDKTFPNHQPKKLSIGARSMPVTPSFASAGQDQFNQHLRSPREVI
jgi:hypothetical protein